MCFDREFEFGLFMMGKRFRIAYFSYIGFSYYRCISATFRKKSSNFSTRVPNPPFQYVEYQMMLWEIYTWDSVRAYHFDFHQARISEGIDDAQAWETPDHELKQYLLVAWPARNTNSHDSRNINTGGNSCTFHGSMLQVELGKRLSQQLQIPSPMYQLRE